MWVELARSALRLCEDEDGATMVEYAIMASFIAAVCMGVVASIGLRTQELFAMAEAGFP